MCVFGPGFESCIRRVSPSSTQMFISLPNGISQVKCVCVSQQEKPKLIDPLDYEAVICDLGDELKEDPLSELLLFPDNDFTVGTSGSLCVWGGGVCVCVSDCVCVCLAPMFFDKTDRQTDRQTDTLAF